MRFTIKEHRHRVRVLAFSHEGSILVSAANDWTVRLWDTVDATQIATLRNQKGVESLRFTPDNKTLALGNGMDQSLSGT